MTLLSPEEFAATLLRVDTTQLAAQIRQRDAEVRRARDLEWHRAATLEFDAVKAPAELERVFGQGNLHFAVIHECVKRRLSERATGSCLDCGDEFVGHHACPGRPGEGRF